jgi:phage tail-like protein
MMAFDKQLLAQANLAFRYVVMIGKTAMAAFTECTLPVIDWEIQEVKEGGLNTHVHQLPGMRKSARLTLKNGVGRGELFDWCTAVMAEKFERKILEVKLLDAHSNEFAVWSISDAYPIKWTGPQLKSDASAIAIQSIEFACGEIRVEMRDPTN